MLRYRLLMAAVLPLLARAQGSVVEGRVTNAATHEGIPGADVQLSSTGRNGENYARTTDATGGFRFEGVKDGEYRPGFGKPGFLPVNLGPPAAPSIKVSSADGPVHVEFMLAPFPTMRGRVLTADGKPVADAAVELVHIGGGGRPKTTSGKDGAFSFSEMLPGPFVLRAVPPPKMGRPETPADEPAVWAPTYYPNVTERFRAERIFAIRDVDGMDIRLVPAPVFHVRGTVVDEQGKPVSGAKLKLVSPDSLDDRSHAVFEEPEGQATSGENGAFDFDAVRAGEWFVLASGKKGTRTVSAVVGGTVTKGDWENIRVRLAEPFPVRGTVERPDARGAAGHHTWVALIPAWQTRLMGIHDEQGEFEIDEIVPGKYQILLEQPLPGSYVDTVQYGGRDVLGQTVDVTDASLRMRVVYRTDGGRVQGTVERCGRGEVVLIPRETALQNSELIRTARCDSAGHFEVQSVRPGTYYAAAFERVDDFTFYYGSVVDMALLGRIIERAATVKVEPGQTATTALTAGNWPE